MSFFTNKKNAALYVKGIIQHSKPNSQLTIIITPEKSGDYCVTFATEELWEDTETPKSLGELMNTYLKEPGG